MKPPVNTANREPNYFLRHWQGDLPLAQVYWIDVVGINCAIRLAMYLFAAYVADRLPAGILIAVLLSFWPCFFLLMLWQIVGVARSANRHAKQSSAKATLAWAALIVMALTFILSFVKSGVPQIAEEIMIARGDPEWPDPVISVLPNGREIEFCGPIKFGSATKLDRFLGEHPEINLLQLDTQGGRDREALAMASVVRRHLLNTYVAQHCESAGVIVFLAGKERILRNNAKVGFHASRAAGITDSSATDRQVEVLMAAGANTRFTEQVINTPPSSIWYPDLQELVDQGLATRITDGTGFSLGSREIAHYTVAALKQELDANPITRALSKREHASYGLAIAHAARMIAQGLDMKTSMKDVNDLVVSVTKDSYPWASNAALDACLALNLEILKRNMYQAPYKTLMVMSRRTPRTDVPDYPSEADVRYITALLESPLIPAPPQDYSQALNDEAALIRKFAEGRDVQKRLRASEEERLRQIFICEIEDKVLTAMKQMAPEQRYPVIRLYFGLGPQRPSTSSFPQSQEMGVK